MLWMVAAWKLNLPPCPGKGSLQIRCVRLRIFPLGDVSGNTKPQTKHNDDTDDMAKEKDQKGPDPLHGWPAKVVQDDQLSGCDKKPLRSESHG